MRFIIQVVFQMVCDIKVKFISDQFIKPNTRPNKDNFCFMYRH